MLLATHYVGRRHKNVLGKCAKTVVICGMATNVLKSEFHMVRPEKRMIARYCQLMSEAAAETGTKILLS